MKLGTRGRWQKTEVEILNFTPRIIQDGFIGPKVKIGRWAWHNAHLG